MSWHLRYFLPGRIGGQIAILIVISLVAIHAIITASILLGGPRDRRGPPEPPDLLLSVVRVVDAVAREDRPALIARIAPAFSRFKLELIPPPASVSAEHDPRLMHLVFRLGPDLRASVLETPMMDRSDDTLRIGVRLRDGDWIAATVSHRPPPPRPFGPAAVTLAFIVVSVSLLGFWAARALIAPLNQFADAAESFRVDGALAPLPERGPYEIRIAAQALNRMRERIKQLIEDRTRMLVAVGHDLRTPITRLRLRSEFIEDEAVRTPMLRDLDQMQTMIEAALMFLRNGGTREQATQIDVATLLQTICDQFADMGHDLTYRGPDHATIVASADEIHRAVTNLVDNAVRHGPRTTVRLAAEAAAVTIEVEDDGPGIRDTQKAAMLEPFVRGDTARGMSETTGFGLGLSIARAVAERHGGSLVLADRAPHGLIVRLNLPRSANALPSLPHA
jgi:signal transduction histidine kinase